MKNKLLGLAILFLAACPLPSFSKELEIPALPARPQPVVAMWLIQAPSSSLYKSQPKSLIKPAKKAETFLTIDVSQTRCDVIHLACQDLLNLGGALEMDLKSRWGFSIGYRKEDIHYTDYGHFFYGKLFKQIGSDKFYLKPGFLVEWGVPSNLYDTTTFFSPTSYRHEYLIRNSVSPVGAKANATLYPGFELAVGSSAAAIGFEAGIRGRFVQFGVEDYDLTAGAYSFQKKIYIIPSVFASLRIKMLGGQKH